MCEPVRRWRVADRYLPTIVQLEVIDIPMFTADFDGDGDVDGDDLAQWDNDFGGAGSDADSDGDSDGTDFFDWQRQYGQRQYGQRQYGSGAAPLAALSAVPEPSTLLLAILAASGGLLLPRHKK